MIKAAHLLTANPLGGQGRGAGWTGAATAAAFAAAVKSGRLNLPLPGSGRTRERWAALADLAGEDLSLARLAEGHADALAILAELGAASAAGEIDADPGDRENGGRLRALRVRALIEATATEVMQRVGRALGAGPLCHDEAHGRRVADLTVYLRQHHSERDLAELGALVSGRSMPW